MLPGENLAAHHLGHARVLALLGVQGRTRSYPWWFDGDRAPVLDYEAHVAESLLARTRVVQAPYFELAYSSARVELRLLHGDCARLHGVLRDAPELVALVPRLSATARYTRVWQPGSGSQVVFWSADEETPAVHGDLAIGANFLILAHGGEPVSMPAEDGFVLWLTPAWPGPPGTARPRRGQLAAPGRRSPQTEW